MRNYNRKMCMHSDRNVVCVIPARLNSRRFPGKLLHPLQGKSLIQRTVENALSISHFSAVFVATDSLEIAQHVQKWVPVLITSSHHRSGTDRIAEVLIKNAHLRHADIEGNIQGDHPQISSDTIGKIVNALAQDPSASIATAAILRSQNEVKAPSCVKCVFDQRGNALYFSRSAIPHGQEECYHHIGIYAFRSAFLRKLPSLRPTVLEVAEDLEQLRFLEHGYTIKVAVTDCAKDAFGVDTPEDATLYEHLFSEKSIA